MTFFKQLTQLVKSLEKDVEEFRSLDCSQKSDPGDESGQKALLVADSLQSEVRELQKCMEETTKALQIDGGFLDLVAVTEALVAKQRANIHQIEEYLQQYGYQPLPVEPQDMTEETGKAAEKCVITKEEDYVSQTEDEELEEQDTENIEKQENSTPKKQAAGDADYDEIMRTPRLEDFGLSEAILNKYKAYAANMKQDQDGTENFRSVPIQPLPVPRMCPVACDVDGMAVPVDFQHAGLCPTPGFTGGRDSTNKHESSFPLETPQVLKSQSHNPDMAANSQGEDDFTAMLSLPDPPVLLTPGVKQIKKLNIHDNPVPVLNMGVVSEQGNVPIEGQSPDNGLGSPVLPVLCTPGVKQLKKPSQVFTPENTKKPILSFTEDCMDTPEMPELTIGWIGLKNLTDQAAQNTGSSNFDMKYTAPHAKGSTGLRINPSEMFRNIGKPSNPVYPKADESVNEDSLPEMPELTTTHGFKAGHPSVTTSTQMNHQTPPSLDCTPLIKSHDVDLSPLPPMPELTGTYNFSMKSSALAKTGASLDELSLNDIRDKNGVGGMEEMMGSHDKENVAPEITPEKGKNSIYSKATPRLHEITESEYSRQPDYVQRIVSLQVLNKALLNLEHMFQQQQQGGEDVCVTERDLQPMLDSRTKPVILSLIKLGRLQLKRQGQEPTYIPVS